MTNFHADKARGFLNLADTARLALDQERFNVQEGDGHFLSATTVAARQRDIANLIAMAQAHATLAQTGPVNIENVTVQNEVPEEAPKDPDEPGQGEQDPMEEFLRSVDEYLGFLRDVGPVVRLFVGPRPVKDTPQA